ncbi:MAG: hypothetical protein NWE82_03390 [Candidatus Bathyarchaeota archaeon]|jgi:hypothetical protein|nr:hypothetical protein [Candidatus Bathyarchaeota archaeon]
MDPSEKRIVASLLLLAGITCLSVALYTNQVAKIAELISGVFEPALAGLP